MDEKYVAHYRLFVARLSSARIYENPVYSTPILWAFIAFGIPITIAVLSFQAVDLIASGERTSNFEVTYRRSAQQQQKMLGRLTGADQRFFFFFFFLHGVFALAPTRRVACSKVYSRSPRTFGALA